MDRIAFVPAGSKTPGKAHVLGGGATGSWIACEGDSLLAGAGKLELLWLARGEYDHAIRRLAKAELPKVIALRRRAFSSRLPACAKSELYALRLRSLATAAAVRDRDAFARSLTALARLAGPSRFQGLRDAGVLVLLLEKQQALRNELSSPEGRDAAGPGELEAHRRFAEQLTVLLKVLGRPEFTRAPLYVPLVRDYLLKPPPRARIAEWSRDGTPAVPWRGGVIGPVRADEAAELAPAKLMFPEAGQAAALQMALTPTQLTVELEDREHDVEIAAHVAALRVELATFRRTAAGLVKDPAVAAALAEQVAVETPIALSALAAHPPFVEGTAPRFGSAAGRAQAPASDRTARQPPHLADIEADFGAAAELLSKLVVFHGLQWQGLAAELLAIAKAG